MLSLDRSLLAGHRALRLAKGSRPPALQLLGFLSLLLPLGKDLGVLSRSQPVLLSPPPLESEPVPLPLEHHGGDKALHLGCCKLLLLSVLEGKGPLNDILANVILLGQVEKLPDLAGTLGSQPARDGVVSQSRDLSLSLLDDGHGKDREVAVDDAPAGSLPLPLVRIPCFMGKPCLSLPPVMRRTYPLNSSPRVSASTSWPILFS